MDVAHEMRGIGHSSPQAAEPHIDRSIIEDGYIKQIQGAGEEEPSMQP